MEPWVLASMDAFVTIEQESDAQDAVLAIEQRIDLLDVAEAKARRAVQLGPHRLDLRAELLSAARARLLNPTRLARDMLRVAYGPGRLSAHEYFYYRLYDPALTDVARLRYLGKRQAERLHAACNDAGWAAALEDKILCYMAVSAAGLPIPETRAIYAPGLRHCGARMIREPQALVGFLRDPSHYPLFVKTIDGFGSIGALSLASVNGECIAFSTGEIARVDAVVRFMSEFGEEGFMLQERLDPQRALRAGFGPTLATIRFLVLLSAEAARVESAVVKIPSARNQADNYWRNGNMLGALDETGRITRVVIGTGGALGEVTTHPETGATLIGLTLPFWEEASELCRQAASIFPHVRTQSWDVALTEKGPVLIEGNYGGAINLHQLAHGRGALTPAFIEHLRRCGCRMVK